MKKENTKSGFTIIETLVAMNLIFLVTTFVVSFYLFALKFISSTSTNIHEKQNIYSFILTAEDVLQKSEYYTVAILKDSLLITLESKKYILFEENKIDLSNYLIVKDIDQWETEFYLTNNEVIVCSSQPKADPPPAESSFESSEIKKINISFTKDKKKYSIHFNPPRESVKRFKNIKG